jgi:hypothetical protein
MFQDMKMSTTEGRGLSSTILSVKIICDLYMHGWKKRTHSEGLLFLLLLLLMVPLVVIVKYLYTLKLLCTVDQ